MKYLNKVLTKIWKNLIPNVILVFKTLKVKYGVLILVPYVLLGQLVNRYYSFKNFTIYQLLFVTALIIAFVEIRRFLKGFEQIQQMTASHPIRFVVNDVSNLIGSNWAIPGLIIISSLYTYSTISLGYLNIDLIGVYGIIMILLIMVTAVLGQTVYVYFIILLCKLAKSDDFRYDFYFPARTGWIVYLSKMGRRLNNSFFILGFIYTLVYFLNVPSTFIIFGNSGVTTFKNIYLNTPNDSLFIAGWVTIFVIVVLAFPVYYILQSMYIKSLVRKLKDKSISEIESIMVNKRLKENGQIDVELKYFDLMRSIENSPDLPQIGSKFIPLLTTIFSISIHVIKISESLLK